MGKRLALAIGIGEYGEGFEALPGSLLDVRAMKSLLEDPDRGAFEVTALENCDRTQMETAIEQFFRDKAPEDILLLYFSGHGDLGSGGISNQQLHFCAHNSYKQNKQLFESSAMSGDFLKRRMAVSQSKQIIVILDCCYSGAIADFLKKGDGDGIDYSKLTAKGRAILASSSASQVSLQEKDGLSLYTRYLLEGMKGAAYKEKGKGDWIVVQDLHAYAERRFEIESKGGYLPKIIAEDTSYNLPIAKAPKLDPKLVYQQAVDRIFQDLDRQNGVAFDGEISKLVRRRLDILLRQPSLNSLSPEIAKQIELEVRHPYTSRAEKRREYAETFQMAVENGYLPDEFDRQMLTEIRSDLALSQEDADRIERELSQQLNLIEIRSQSSGLDYKELGDLLRNKKWQEADQKTSELMLRVAKREKEGWLDVEAIKNFPVEDLQIVDLLWIKCSEGLYGFSIQKKIWEECGSPQKDGKDWEKFGDCVGWNKNGQWLGYDDLIFQPETSPHSLPRGFGLALGWIGFAHPGLNYNRGRELSQQLKLKSRTTGNFVPTSTPSTEAQAAKDRIDSPAPANSQSDIATSSQTSGTDYKELGDLLRNKKWREANEMTAELMLKVAIKQDESCLNEKALKNFPTEDLQIIDRLWVKYSDGCSGFSVQKKIWEECGSPREYSEDWEKFGDRVGWRKEGQWLTYSDRIFQPEISPNSLPWTVDICGGVLMVYRCYSLFSHPGLNHSIEQELSQQLNLKLRHTPPVISPPAPESLHPPQTPAVSQPAITTKSQTTGTDYTELSNLLRDKQWENADKKTAELILEVAKREKRGYLDVEDIEKFPIEDLQIIDRLWVKYSKGKYGFSVQKKVWEKCGSPKRYGEEWKRFGDLVGWRRGDDWLSYHELVSNPKKYTLPARCLAPWSFATYGWYDTAGFFEHSKDNCGGWSCFSSFASRL